MVNPKQPDILCTHLIVIITHVRVMLIGTRTKNIVENHATLVVSHVKNAKTNYVLHFICCIV